MFSENQFCSLLIWDLLRLNPWVFCLKFLPDVRHCVYWVLAETWAPDSSQEIVNKFFINHCLGWKEGSSMCETVWFFSWVNTHPFDPKFVAFCPKFSGDSYVEFQEKTITGEFFRNFVQTKGYLSSTKTCEILPNFLQFYSGSVLHWKIHTSTFICRLHPVKEARP